MMTVRKCETCRYMKQSSYIEPCNTCFAQDTAPGVYPATYPFWEPPLLAEVLAPRAKHDATQEVKTPYQALPWAALEAVAMVLRDGAEHYGMDNWRKGAPWREFLGSAFRHLIAFARGEDKDAKSGHHPLAHCACDVLFLLTWALQKQGTDDRVKE